MTKHVITFLKLDEISGVDRPAQAGATVRFMKRANTPTPEPKEQPVFKTREELLAAITKALADPAYATANQAEIMKAATTLGALADVPQSISKAAPATDPEVLKRLEKFEKVSGLTGVHKAHYDALPAAEQDAFLALDAAGRDTEVNKAKGDDPVVYTTMEGLDIRKSAGEVVLALAKSADKDKRELLAERAERKQENLAKRANDELSNFTGTIEVRTALLKAVDTISDTTVRGDVLKSLTAANSAMGGAFNNRGNPAPRQEQINKSLDNPDDQLEQLAKNLVAQNPKLAYHEAYSQVLDTPAGRELYAASADTSRAQ